VRRLLRALVGPNWELVNRRLAGFLYLSVHLRMSRAVESAAKLLTKARGAADCGEYREATGVSEDLAVARAKRAVPRFPRNFVLPQEFAPGDGVGMGVAAVCSREKH
jgi:hypothetical protein